MRPIKTTAELCDMNAAQAIHLEQGPMANCIERYADHPTGLFNQAKKAMKNLPKE